MNKYKKLLKTIGVRLRNQIDSNKGAIKNLKDARSRRNYLNSYPVLPKINITDLYELLNSIFGDNWEITKEYLIVKYDSVTVTNDNGTAHTIQDLYIRYNYKNNYHYPEAFKATYTFGELDSHYLHSHIKCRFYSSDYEDYYNRWSNSFCWGDHICQMFSNAQSKNIYITDDLYMLISTMHEWLKEESTHTSPYAYISNTIQQRDKRFDYGKVDLSNIDFSSLEIYEVIKLSNLEVAANTLEVMENQPNYSDFLCYYTNQGTWALDSKIIESTPIELPADFYFKRKRVMFRVVNEEESNLTPTLHPQIISKFNHKINEYVNKHQEEIVKTYLELYSKNREESVESTSILLQGDSIAGMVRDSVLQEV